MVESIAHTTCSEFRRSETDSPAFGGLRKEHAAYEMQCETCCSHDSCYSWIECCFTARIWHLCSFNSCIFLQPEFGHGNPKTHTHTQEGAAARVSLAYAKAMAGWFKLSQNWYQWKFTPPRDFRKIGVCMRHMRPNGWQWWQNCCRHDPVSEVSQVMGLPQISSSRQ